MTKQRSSSVRLDICTHVSLIREMLCGAGSQSTGSSCSWWTTTDPCRRHLARAPTDRALASRAVAHLEKLACGDASEPHLEHAVALETGRGCRIAKEKVSHKIDVVVALAMAALGAVQGGQRRNAWLNFIRADTARMERETGLPGNGLCANLSCRRPMPADGTVFQSRGLQFCSNQCSW